MLLNTLKKQNNIIEVYLPIIEVKVVIFLPSTYSNLVRLFPFAVFSFLSDVPTSVYVPTKSIVSYSKCYAERFVTSLVTYEK